MAGIKYLMDTNTAIDYIGGLLSLRAATWLDTVIETEVSISVINKIEILGFNMEQVEDMIPFQELVSILKLLYVTDEVTEQTIELRKKYKIKLPDAIIAATALVYDLTLLSRNEKDFNRIVGLKWQNLHRVV